MGSTRRAVLVALSCGLTLIPWAASAAPARDAGLLQQKNPEVDYVINQDFKVPADPTPEGNIVGDVVAVDVVNSATSGCEDTDFIGFPAGSIALIKRGTCELYRKVLNAQAAGASGVLIFNSFSGLDFFPGLGGAAITVPVLYLSRDLGATFVATPNLRVHMLIRHDPKPGGTA